MKDNHVGIDLDNSSNNNLTHNTVEDNNDKGIFLSYFSNNNTLTYNTVEDNDKGIFLSYFSNNNTLTYNTVEDNDYGIYIFRNSNFNKILGNKISNNNETGIRVTNCDIWGWCSNWGNSNNSIEGNEILHNKIGIYSQNSNSTINNNYVCGNNQSDFNSTDWGSSYGYNNACNKSDSWNDTGTTGCTYTCGVACKELEDIFGVVKMLEYLSLYGQKNSNNSQYCDLNKDGVINLLDILVAIDKIVTRI